MLQPSLTKDEKLLPDSTLHWSPKSRNHRDKFEKLMKVESKNLKRIGPAKVCFNHHFKIGMGSGGTCVYIGLLEDGTEVAVKKVLTSSCGEMAMNELKFVNLAESTNSRHLVRCRYFKKDDDFYYFVLDLFEETLADFVQKQSQTKKSLEDNGPIIIKELLTGLQALHCGELEILHMDLKRRNILVDIDGHMHLTDFGISRILPEGESTVSTETIGTKGWRAVETLSEQNNSRVKYKRRSDIQVMGMICFYILTKGKHPFGTMSDEREKNLKNGKAVEYDEITNPLARELISWMLEHDIEKRPHVEEALKHPYLSDLEYGMELPDQYNYIPKAAANRNLGYNDQQDYYRNKFPSIRRQHSNPAPHRDEEKAFRKSKTFSNFRSVLLGQKRTPEETKILSTDDACHVVIVVDTEDSDQRDNQECTVKTVKIGRLNADVYRTVCIKLNLNIDGKDWKTLAGKMGYSSEFVKQLQRLDDPADGLLAHWGTKSGNDVTKLIELLLEMERSDITEQLESEHI